MARKQKTKSEDYKKLKQEIDTPPKKKFTIHDVNTFKPLTKNQSILFKTWQDNPELNFLMCGSAGTGKTFLAIYLGIIDLINNPEVYDKLVIIRSAVQGRDLGFTPGTLEEKMELYESPYIEIFNEIFKYSKSYENLKKLGKIEFHSTSFLRGITFSNRIIVLDEVQNLNKNEVHTALSRVGQNSKLFICGDNRQCDLHKKNDVSGFTDLYEIAVNMREYFEVIEYSHDDIVRSNFTKAYIITRDKLGL